MKTMIHLCQFSSLDELTKSQRREPIAVLYALRKIGRFSDFEVDEVSGKTLMNLQARGWIEFDTSCGYPWTQVTLTRGGRAQIAGLK